jgi:hypothetical protein
MINFINNLIFKILLIYINWKYGVTFNTIISKTSLEDNNITLSHLFEHIYNSYKTELQEKGLVGLWRLRREVLANINSMNWPLIHSRHKTLSEETLLEYASKLKVFKDLLTKIKYTVETLKLVKIILGILTNIAFIPVMVLATYWLFKRILVIFSILSSSIFSLVFFTNQLDGVSTLREYLIRAKLTLKDLSIKTHNYLFDDDLISRSILPSDIKKEWSYYSYVSEWLATYNIDSNSLALIGGAIISFTTAYLVWNGTINKETLKDAWSWLLSLFSSDDDQGGNNPPSFPSAPTDTPTDTPYFRNMRDDEGDNYSTTSERSQWRGIFRRRQDSSDTTLDEHTPSSHTRNLSEVSQALHDEFVNPNTTPERSNQLDQEFIQRNKVKIEREETFSELPLDYQDESDSESDKTINNKGKGKSKLTQEELAKLSSVPLKRVNK